MDLAFRQQRFILDDAAEVIAGYTGRKKRSSTEGLKKNLRGGGRKVLLALGSEPDAPEG